MLGRYRKRPRRVLMVSQDPHWHEVVRRALGSEAQVRRVSDGESGLDALRLEPFDWVIVDTMGIPDLLQLVAAIRDQLPALRHLIMAAAAPTWRQVRDALRAGATDFVVKSEDGHELQAVWSQPGRRCRLRLKGSWGQLLRRRRYWLQQATGESRCA